MRTGLAERARGTRMGVDGRGFPGGRVVRARLRAALLLVVALPFGGVGCAHTYTSEPLQKGESRLSAQSSVYVALPADASFGGRLYDDSGLQTAEALAAAFRLRVARVLVASAPEDHDAALASARARGVEYVAEAFIDHWEDRMTEWSGKPDRISIRIGLYRAESGELLDAVRLEGRSRWGTLGGDHPQDLLAVPVSSYVESLF